MGFPIFLRCSHTTRGTDADKLPGWPSLFSYKAVTERAGILPTDLYGGIRMFNANSFPQDMGMNCWVNTQVDVSFQQTPSTTAVHQATVIAPGTADFQLKYFCCSGSANTIMNDVLFPFGSGTSGQFSIMKNAMGAGEVAYCACPPLGYPAADLGLLFLDMSTTHAADATWEPPEEFGIQYLSGQPAPIPTGPPFFAIADKDIGPVWIIQDSCESASLFTYQLPLPAYTPGVPGRPCIQFSPDFSEVGGHPTNSTCLAPYYSAGPAPFGANLVTYILQNSPGAASEVMLESSHMQLLLGYIDRNAAAASEVKGDFYNGLGATDEVEVLLRVENQNNWSTTPPAGCPSGPPAYPYYATAGNSQTAGRDFYLEQLLPNPGADCALSTSAFTWTLVEPTQLGADWIYHLYFKGDQLGGSNGFLKKLLGLRIVGIDEHISEGPEIVHLELLAATLRSTGAPVNLGWSRAFRIVLLDGLPPQNP